MAYVDRQSGTRRAATLAGVTIFQAAIGVVLVYGLAVKFASPPIYPPIITEDVPLPTPTPTEEKVEKAKHDESVVTAPDPKIEITPREQPYVPPTPEIPRIPDVVATAQPAGDFRIKELPRTPLFTVKSPRPANDQSSWVTTEEYPAPDIRRGHTGTSRYRVTVGINGRVTGCDIVKSSGWAGLDEATCSYVSKRARFEAATDNSGARTVGDYTGSVVWQIPR